MSNCHTITRDVARRRTTSQDDRTIPYVSMNRMESLAVCENDQNPPRRRSTTHDYARFASDGPRSPSQMVVQCLKAGVTAALDTC
jgi:hypothetical protein